MGETEPTSITLRPSLTLRAMSAVGTVAGLVAVVQWSLAVLDGATATVVLVVGCAAVAVIGLRHQASYAELTGTGAEIRNTFRSKQVDWSEVARAEWAHTGGWGSSTILTFSGKARLVLADGRRLNLSATTVLTYPGAATVTSALRRTAGQAGVPVQPATPDGGPSRRTA